MTSKILCLLSLFAASLAAQTVNGRIVGNVNDASGAMVPGAAVTVRHLETSTTRSAVTSEAGSYVVPNLQIGSYEVTVELAGFKRHVRGPVRLDVDQTARIDVQLETGDIADKITVGGGAAAVQTDQSSLGQVIENQTITQLPLNGRNFIRLGSLLPGTTRGAPGNSVVRGRQEGEALTVNGQRAEHNNYMLDGADNNETLFGVAVMVPSVDALQEFKVQTANYSAEFGRAAGAVINVSIKWGANYYRSTAVFSSDRGKTWSRTSVLADDPLAGDCEVGVCEYALGKLIAISRIGDGGGRYGQPSRIFHSEDFGRSWSRPVMAPIYAQRAIVKPLRNGKLGVSFRNNSGTTGTCFFTMDAKEKFSFQPNSTIWDEARCRLERQALEVKTAEGRESAVEFTFFPVEDDDSAVEFDVTMEVKQAARNGCNVCAGAWVRFLPDRVELADRPRDGFAIDATKRHSYRIVNREKRIRIEVDGKPMLDVGNEGVFTRHVRLGNRSGGRPQGERKDSRQPLRGTQYMNNAAHFLCHTMQVKVSNRRDFSIDWRWTPGQGYPDQFYRDRVTRLEKNGSFAAGDSGYSSWAQHPDGTIVVADYTCGNPPAAHPFLRAYRL